MIDLDAIRANAADSKRRIGEMCANLRPPKMSIPVSPNDDDEFICRTLDDLLAYVDALAAKFLACKEHCAALESREVCTVAHDNVETCGCAEAVDALAARLAEAERNESTLLGMIRHQRDVLRECLPYLNESMAGRRPGRSADDIRAAVKALTADSASGAWDRECVKCACKWVEAKAGPNCPRCGGEDFYGLPSDQPPAIEGNP